MNELLYENSYQTCSLLQRKLNDSRESILHLLDNDQFRVTLLSLLRLFLIKKYPILLYFDEIHHVNKLIY